MELHLSNYTGLIKCWLTPVGLLSASSSFIFSISLSQVLFNENQSQLVKLDVAVVRGSQRLQRLQCMEGYGTTPAAGSHQFHFLKPCQVSGLLRLEKGVELQAITGPAFNLHITGKHYFGLFKVNWAAGEDGHFKRKEEKPVLKEVFCLTPTCIKETHQCDISGFVFIVKSGPTIWIVGITMNHVTYRHSVWYLFKDRNYKEDFKVKLYYALLDSPRVSTPASLKI